MLVITSDLYLTQKTLGETIDVGAFRVSRKRRRQLVDPSTVEVIVNKAVQFWTPGKSTLF